MSRGSSERAKTTKTPPYTSYRTFTTFIQDLREHGVPSRIDRSVLTRFSGVVGTQLIHALRFLGLIEDEGRPTERLRALVTAESDGRWPEMLLELLRQEYAPLFAIDLESATPSHFHDTFRKAYPAADAVVQKCVTFFLYAASDARVKISGRVLKGRKPRFPTPRRRPPSASPAREAPPAPPPLLREGPRIDVAKPSEILLLHLEPKAMDDEQQAAVWTLMKYFKARGL
jgi:Family of unknown function (DUF5343)